MNIKRPRIIHPSVHEHRSLDSDVHSRIAAILQPHATWFCRGGDVVMIERVPCGFKYASAEDEKFIVEAYSTGFEKLTALKARSHLERYMVPGSSRRSATVIARLSARSSSPKASAPNSARD